MTVDEGGEAPWRAGSLIFAPLSSRPARLLRHRERVRRHCAGVYLPLVEELG